MRLLRLLAGWFWRVDAFLGGNARPDASRRFVAAHFVRGALIVGPVYGGLFAVLLLILGVPFTPPALLSCLGIAVGGGMWFMGLDYFERLRQRHYGCHPHEAQDEPGGND
ncbi:hypothetical protein [Nonomuraea sediminis]|uniref:hypothetical protein n=1 Tax=Nonomuraea sediminis TaxID=2835864 RepID=UPI001BDD70F8|nr:hypothetical protein [Nonomuraea sediminis]